MKGINQLNIIIDYTKKYMKKKYNYINFKNYKLNFKWILPVFIIIVILSFFGFRYIKILTYKNIYKTISELSNQTVTQLDQSIDEQKRFVETTVDSIDKGYFETEAEIFDNFSDDLEDYHFTRLAILDRNGNGITSDGFTVTDYPITDDFFDFDNVYLSENRKSIISDAQINIYSKAFYLDGQEKVLFATINTENYKEILLRRLYNGLGGTYLINNNGTVLIDSFDIIKENDINLYDFFIDKYNVTDDEKINTLNNMKENVKNGKAGTFDISLDEEKYFVNYQSIGINDWYVINIVPINAIASELNQFIAITFGVCVLINFIIVGISIYIDISNQMKNRKLYKSAYIDPVTLLGNENYFKEFSGIFLNSSKENKFVIIVDINKFKFINNLYGYDFCNKLLNIFGEKIKTGIPKNNITCRMHNDVFAVILEYDKDIKQILEKIYNDVSVLNIDNVIINLSISMGVYKIKKSDTDINKILDKAYIAHKQIKGTYSNYYYMFDEALENSLINEEKIEATMEEALKNKEFKVIYQPKFSTSDEKIVGAESLVRWYKNNSVIMPNDFIPIFEKNKFILKLDLYIFEQVCKDLAYWKEEFNANLKVSVNVSKEHFVDENFIEKYVEIVNKYNIDRKNLELEITESATIDKNIDVVKIANKIKSYGFSISLDDFGTGYSSLAMLQELPIDVIKIDKIFVDKADYKSDKNIINYMVLIAKQLNTEIVVEGVETKEQADFIKALHCDIIQGYYYSKPIEKEKIEEYFRIKQEKSGKSDKGTRTKGRSFCLKEN